MNKITKIESNAIRESQLDESKILFPFNLSSIMYSYQDSNYN